MRVREGFLTAEDAEKGRREPQRKAHLETFFSAVLCASFSALSAVRKPPWPQQHPMLSVD
jgi:hypothetical protein